MGYRLALRASPSETPEGRRRCRLLACRKWLRRTVCGMTGGAQTVSVSCTRGTITTPSRFSAVATEAMKILAHASTRYALNPGSTAMLTRWMAAFGKLTSLA